MSRGSFRGGRWGYLPFRHHDNRYSADWIRLCPGLSENSEDGNSCPKSHKAARFDWSRGKSGQQWDWDYKPEYGCHHVETHGFASENWWFQRPEWTERISCEGMQLFAPKDTTKFNPIFSGSPRTGWLWPRSCWINYPGRAMQCRLSCSLPPLQTLLPSPDQLPSTALYRHLSSRSATGAVINGTGPDGCLPELDMFPPVASHVFMVYVLLCWGVFFLFSHCTPQWSIVWGLNSYFFFLSFLM